MIPKTVSAQVGLSGQAELTVEPGAIVLREPGGLPARVGRGSPISCDQGDDELLMGEFANAVDLELKW